MRTKGIYVVILALAAVATARAEEWNKTYNVSGKPEIRLDTDDGSIRVLGSREGQVRAIVSTCGWKFGEGAVNVVERQNGNRIEIGVRVPGGPHVLVFGCKSVHVELTVPAASDLDLHSKDGSISVSDVKGNERLNTGDGRIEARGLDGSLKADTRDGSITVDGRFDVLELHTGDGRIDASARAGSKMAGGWTLRTKDGSVTLRLPRDIAADLDAHTGDGRITSDFPVTISGTSDADSRSMRGKLNGGGPLIEIRTGDGSVRVSRDYR